jgi:MarC family membrane protein
MSTEAQFWITCFITLFFIVDPFAAVPLFLSLTAKHGPAKRIRIARHASLWCGAILLVFAAAGSWILGLYGISLPALRTGGGIILLLVALDMVRTRRSTQETPEEMKSAATRDDISLTPLAMPILSGPGAISTVIVLMGSAHGAGRPPYLRHPQAGRAPLSRDGRFREPGPDAPDGPPAGGAGRPVHPGRPEGLVRLGPFLLTRPTGDTPNARGWPLQS